ncbi:hypothetical protein [Brevundimonas sp.]|uniref:acylneuraminate cytidylyltransferase family protein n=1 Tax=Brevundimonas sp. TaxID=1871086 RepID=UPI001A22A0AF|nr:hypothetical protein [Brevundimonas sp.]MBJ7483561.1 hypothetical protein [Brevundimonas sp.]
MSETSNVIAIVPAKGWSGRVPNKNFRPFHGERSMLEIKLEQLRAVPEISAIYVSSDVEAARDVAEANGAIFLPRDPRLTLDTTPWSEVLCGVLEQAPVPSENQVAWAPLTNPLFTRYSEAIAMLGTPAVDGRGTVDSIMSVTRQQHYFLNADFLPVNYQWGVWASYSQLLKPLYQMNCALWLARKGDMIRNRFQVGDRPGFLVTDPIEGLDIDTMDEFEMAQFFYAKRFGG